MKTLILTISLGMIFACSQAQVNPKKWHRQNSPDKCLFDNSPKEILPKGCTLYREFHVKTISAGLMGATIFVLVNPFIGGCMIVFDGINYFVTKNNKYVNR